MAVVENDSECRRLNADAFKWWLNSGDAVKGHRMGVSVYIGESDKTDVIILMWHCLLYICTTAYGYISLSVHRQHFCRVPLSSHDTAECTRTLSVHTSCEMFTWIFYTNYYDLLTRVRQCSASGWLKSLRYFKMLSQRDEPMRCDAVYACAERTTAAGHVFQS